MERATKIDRGILDELVQRIVEVASPRRIVLFGSAARGDLGPHSDLDVLVVMPDGAHRRNTAKQIYRARFDLGYPKDIVVVTENDVRRFGDEHSLVICPALKEGKNSTVSPEREIPGSSADRFMRARSDIAIANAPLPEGAL